MNRDFAKGITKHFEIIKAFAEGKTIQFSPYLGKWEDTDYPLFGPDSTYRVKPDELWVLVENGKLASPASFKSKKDADDYAKVCLRRYLSVEAVKVEIK